MLISHFERDPELEAIVSVGLVQAEGLKEGDCPELREEITRSVTVIRRQFEGMTAGQIDKLKPARELYRSIGIEPTRYRPSPEALIRRLLKGGDFPEIYPAVDLANLWAIESGLPVGLYDLDKIRGRAVALRLGREGESYEGIRKGEIHASGRLVVADDEGPFGNPSSDSLRTAVDESSRRLLYVLYAPPSISVSTLDLWIAWLRERADAFLGTQSVSAIIP